MKLAGVIGWPVGHSLSPLLHSLWLAECAIAGAYVPLGVRREDFFRALRGLRLSGFVGLNVTLPHKEAAFAIADRWDRASLCSGAANLLLFAENGIEARNTDVEGLTAALAPEIEERAQGRQAAVVGAGGAARACVLACDRLGAASIVVLNRSPLRAGRLLAALAPHIRARLSVAPIEDWPAFAPTSSLLVHATSAGMGGTPSLALSLEALPKTAVVCDIVYDPLETPLLADARRRGLTTVDGLAMLMNQAVPAFEALFGARPSVTGTLRGRLEQALRDGR